MKTFFMQTTNFGLFLFVGLAIYNIVVDIKKDISSLEKIEIIKKEVNRIESNSKVVLELQRERGLTNIYFANPSKLHLKKVLTQRSITAKTIVNDSNNLKKSLSAIHNQVDKSLSDRIYIFNYYSELVRNLLLDTRSLTYNSGDKTLKNELAIYNDLNSLQEILGQLRAKVGLVLASNNFTAEEDVDIKRSNILFQHQLETTFINDLLSSGSYTKKISKTRCLKKSFLISKTLATELEKGENRLSAIEWFSISTCAIDKINFYINEQLNIINMHIENKIENLQTKRIRNLIFWLFGFSILAIFVYIASRKSFELRKEQAMLKNYKKAIDDSSMVYTSNIDGLITHVNKKLSDISGYKEEELLGKKFNTIMDLDVAKETSSDIYKSVLNNVTYENIIKNRTKNGSFFWSDTSVVPILDDRERLVEYITIAHDISETIELHDEIQDTQRELLYRLAEAVESRNKDSGNHIKRVSYYSRLLAELSNLSDEDCEIIFAASSMHDVGKIAIPDEILLKPAKLNKQEWQIMKTHSEIGYGLFKDSTRPLLKAAADIAYEHHEHYNGKGYPRGLKGEEISIFGRIVAIADVFDALFSKRPYKEPWNLDEILSFLQGGAGGQFDPNLIRLFIDNIDEFLDIYNRYSIHE